MQNMLASFSSPDARDKAAAEAIESNILVEFVGTLAPVVNGKPSEHQTPIVIFTARDPMDALFFMQHDAGCCSNL